MSDITDKAAEENRRAWNSLRRQRDEALGSIRQDSAAAISAGRRGPSRVISFRVDPVYVAGRTRVTGCEES